MQRPVLLDRQLYFMHSCDERLDYQQCLLHGGGDFGVKIVIEMGAWHAHAEAVRAFGGRRHVIAYRNIRGGKVGGIVSCDGLEHSSGIAHGRSQRSNMVQRPRQRNYSAARNPAIRGLKANAAAESGRLANGASRIGPDRRITQPGGDGSR